MTYKNYTFVGTTLFYKRALHASKNLSLSLRVGCIKWHYYIVYIPLKKIIIVMYSTTSVTLENLRME